MKIDDLIRRMVDDKRRALLANRKAQLGAKASEITFAVMHDPEFAASLALIREDPFDLRELVRRHVKSRVAQYLRSARWEDGTRQWENVRLHGQREGRYMPTRGMMIWQWRASGNAKIRHGADTLHEGRFLLAMVDDAQRRGYKDNDVVTAGDFSLIVKAAKLTLAS